MNIENIAKDLREGVYINTPHKAGHDVSILAGEFAFICGQLEEVLQTKPAIWNELRKDFKSDTACERAWENSPNGMKEMSLRLSMKKIEKMMSALRSLIRVYESQTLTME